MRQSGSEDHIGYPPSLCIRWEACSAAEPRQGVPHPSEPRHDGQRRQGQKRTTFADQHAGIQQDGHPPGPSREAGAGPEVAFVSSRPLLLSQSSPPMATAPPAPRTLISTRLNCRLHGPSRPPHHEASLSHGPCCTTPDQAGEVRQFTGLPILVYLDNRTPRCE